MQHTIPHGRVETASISTHEKNKEAINKAMSFIAKYEGLRLKSYWDVKEWAICYGNRSKKGEIKTKQECKDILRNRVAKVMNWIRSRYPSATENQVIALTSLYYNVKNPYHVYWRFHNGYSSESVANAIRMYDVASGEKLRGLTQRRHEEADLFLTQ